MKKIIYVLSLALFPILATSALARTPMAPFERAMLTSLSIDPSLSYAGSVHEGDVVVDHNSGTIKLELYGRPNCTPPVPCPQYIIYEKVELPIVSIQTDSCGIRILMAGKDERPVDGALDVLEIRDNRFNHCPTFVPLPPTSISYDTSYEGRQGNVKTHSTFTADSLTRSRR